MSSHVTELFSLQGKLALVTGSGLIPHAIAALLRDAGAQVVHAAEPALDEEAVETAFSPLRELDILVNGSVRAGAWPIDRLELDEWDRVHATNVRGAFLLMREAAVTVRAPLWVFVPEMLRSTPEAAPVRICPMWLASIVATGKPSSVRKINT